MAAREPDWVPGDAWLAPGYAEWAPPAALRGAVACLWASVVPDGADRTTLVLPDACSDLVWEQGIGGYVAGPDTGPVRTVTKAGTVIVGVRFRPSAGEPSSACRSARSATSASPSPPCCRRPPGGCPPASLPPGQQRGRSTSPACSSRRPLPTTRSRRPLPCCATRRRAPKTSPGR